MMPYTALPSQVDFRGLTPQGCRPTRIRHINRPSAVAAKLVREAEQHEFLLAMLCRFACVAEEDTPGLVGDVVLYQILHSLPTPRRGGAARFLATFGFLALRVRDQAAESRRPSIDRHPDDAAPAAPGSVVAVTEMLVKCSKRAG